VLVMMPSYSMGLTHQGGRPVLDSSTWTIDGLRQMDAAAAMRSGDFDSGNSGQQCGEECRTQREVPLPRPLGHSPDHRRRRRALPDLVLLSVAPHGQEPGAEAIGNRSLPRDRVSVHNAGSLCAGPGASELPGSLLAAPLSLDTAVMVPRRIWRGPFEALDCRSSA
jgi:hypothetical protein